MKKLVNQFNVALTNNYIKTTLCILLLGLSFFYTTSLTAQTINGENANFVMYSGPDDGSFKQLNGKKWEEYKANETTPHATFTERARDEWSIYLTKSNGLEVQLDLYTREVKIHNRAYYQIAESKLIINGWNTNYVKYSGEDNGIFKQLDGKKWEERKANQTTVHATFTETGRDEWSIYLTKSDGLKIQLDLHTKEVKIHKRAYYEIVDSKLVLNGWNVGKVIYVGSNSGRFIQGNGKNWTEYKKGISTPHATFIETSRDEWSIYLTKQDGLKVQLDLHTKDVKIHDRGYFKIIKSRLK